MGKNIIICDRCDMENPTTSKYCRGCGYELPFFENRINNQEVILKQTDEQDNEIDENMQETSSKKILKIILCIVFVLLYLIAFFTIPFFYNKYIPVDMSGLGILLSLFVTNFAILFISLIISLLLVYKNPPFSFIVFIIGVILTLIVDFLQVVR